MEKQRAKGEDEEDGETDFSPFYGIEKGAVLQEARVFNEPQIDARRCQQVITKLLYLATQGETFTKTEATEVFFAATKLFQSKDPSLRRMVYLIIKEISPGSDEVIIVTASLMKDINSKMDLYRSNAIRVLCRITDSAMLSQIERYLKQAVVDKSPVVASAALVSGMHLLRHNAELVKRWSSEVQEAANSKHPSVQFHALALLHQLRLGDRLAVSKLVASMARSGQPARSPLAHCLLVRYAREVIAESGAAAGVASGGGERPLYDFLEAGLRHKSEMVIFDAARAIASLPEVTARELAPAVTVLQLFLTSSKPVLRFAAARTLSRIAVAYPSAVVNCKADMETLITDPNRSIATLAITTLLKIGAESDVDKFLKQIGTFMSDIADEFKIVVVDSIRSLCLKFPAKHRSLMNFLSGVLREEGGFEYKKAIVESVLVLIRDIPDAKEAGLAHLCEFIEDCEFTYLSTQILHVLGAEGPKTADPSKYIRYIYNRVVLENATVRASAVSALARFGVAAPALQPRVVVLLRRCLHDNDDEVRDRAALYLRMLTSPESVGHVSPALLDPLAYPLAALETCLRDYVASPAAKAFDLSTVPLISHVHPAPAAAGGGGMMSHLGAAKTTAGAGGGAAAVAAAAKKDAAATALLLSQVPELSRLGKVFKSSPQVQLTEAETEYAVACTKHILPGHVVLQFDCTNTIAEQVLEAVSVEVDTSAAPGFEEELFLPLAVMPYGAVGHTFVVLRRPAGAAPGGPAALATGRFGCCLKFKVKEVDPATGVAEEDGYADEYTLEAVPVTLHDYTLKTAVGNFRQAWDAVGDAVEREDEYSLGPRPALQDAVDAVVATLGLQPCEGTEVAAPNARSHTCLLAGVFAGYSQVLVRLTFGMDAAGVVAMKVCARSDDAAISDTIHEIIAS